MEKQLTDIQEIEREGKDDATFEKIDEEQKSEDEE